LNALDPQTKRLLTVATVLEAPTDLALLVLPSFLSTLLLGSSLDGPVASTVARVAGVAILALAIACWIARHDGQSRAAKGLVGAMLLYNGGVATLLAYASMALGLSGLALWPVVLIHAAMAAWCLMRLLNPPVRMY
jgi:hypothetical protein